MAEPTTNTPQKPANPSSAPIESPAHKAPQGAVSEHSISLASGTMRYRVEADWILLREDDEPVAEVFYSAYLQDAAKGEAQRPLIFLFNGGPGASSAYLHVGAVSPRRVVFGERGQVPAPPVRLADNAETWLGFADLVFVDPVGTGLSRSIDKKAGEDKKSDKTAKANPFYKLGKDLDSLGELMARFLTKHHRWDSPIFIAGESYGGFRVGKLARRLQEGFGIGLNGAILISPALELGWLLPSDYDVVPYVDSFPTMAAVAHLHGRARAMAKDAPIAQVLAAAETFAVRELAPYLLAGRGASEESRRTTIDTMASFLGLPTALLARAEGRVRIDRFTRELLRDQETIVGLYDGSVTARDAFPDRAQGEGPDPTLFALERLFASGINAHLRRDLGLETDREYKLLSLEVNEAWSDDTKKHAFESNISATDDLRYAMALNPDMNVFITHGHFDLVTPYFTSKRLVDLMRLDERQRSSITMQNFHGGHMFYAWEQSRREFQQHIGQFVGRSLPR